MKKKMLTNNGKKSKNALVIVGADLGHSNSKVVFGNCEDEYIEFPSMVHRMVSLGFDEAQIKRDHANDVLLEDGMYIAVGHAAEALRGQSQGERVIEWQDGRMAEHRLLLLKAALAHRYAKVKDGEMVSVRVVLALPIKLMEYARVMEAIFTDTHSVRTVGGANFVANVTAHVQPEGKAAIYSQRLDWTGDIVDTDNRVIAVCDMGRQTVDIGVEIEGKMPKANSRSVDSIQHYFPFVRDSVKRDFDLDINDDEAEQVISKGRFTAYNQEVNAQAIRKTALTLIVNSIANELMNMIQKGQRLSRLLIVGGMAIVIGDALRQRYAQIAVIPDNPVFANAEGLYKWGQMKARAETNGV